MLNIHLLLKEGYDLFLTQNGVILIYDDLPSQFFVIIEQFPYIGCNCFNKTSGHGLPPEVRSGAWRPNMTALPKYKEYLSSDEISKYLENDQLVEFRVRRNPFPKRRQTAWEFMGQDTPPLFLKLLDNFYEERRYPAACDIPSSSASAEAVGSNVPSSSASAEVFGTEAPEAEVLTGSTPVEEVNIEAEFSTLNKIELQSVRIITENPWHLYTSGILTLRDNKGERVLNPFGEPVLCIREFCRLSSSQQEELRAQGINRLVRERLPLTGHAVMSFTRSWELGRNTAYVKNYNTSEEQEEYSRKLRYYENVGWLRDIPEPFQARPGDENPASQERQKIEEDEDRRDQGELRMFDLLAEAIEDLYAGIVDKYVRRTPALWGEFAQRTASGDMYLVDPDPFAPTPTVPTSENLCIDIHNNLKFSPRLALWAVERKLEVTHENIVSGTFADYVLGQLREYVNSRKEIQDNFYKHLVINTQTRTFEDTNYVNSIGSKVVIRPLAEALELSVKRDQQLQRTMVQHDPVAEGDLPSGEIPDATGDEVAEGDLPSGEIPDATEQPKTEDSPTDEMAVEEAAEVSEYLPPGKKSKTEATEEDVEMEAQEEHEEPPQDDEPMPIVVDMPDYDRDEDEDSVPEEEMMERANALLNSSVYNHFAHEEEPERRESGERIATPAMAKFLHRMLGPPEINRLLEVEEEAQRIRKRRLQANAVEVTEEQVYGEELEERKNNDIFTQTSTKEFLQAFAPETEESISQGQRDIEEYLLSGRQGYSRLHQNKITMLQPLEPEKRWR